MDDQEESLHKAGPEADAVLVVKREREGVFHMLSTERSPAWFISDTGMLNRIEEGLRITWQTEAFLRFVATVTPEQASAAADAAFEAILWAVARSGVSMISDEAVTEVFGGIVDGAALSLEEQREVYHETLEAKYGATADAVLGQVSAKNRPVAAIQLLNEMLEKQKESTAALRADLQAQRRRAAKAAKEAEELASFKRKLEAKRAKGKRKRRKGKNKAGRKR
jgi:hypothetical protein